MCCLDDDDNPFGCLANAFVKGIFYLYVVPLIIAFLFIVFVIGLVIGVPVGLAFAFIDNGMIAYESNVRLKKYAMSMIIIVPVVIAAIVTMAVLL